MSKIAAALEALLAQVADRPALVAILACLLLEEGQADRARELARRALATAPNDPEVMNLAAMVLSRGLPDWHVKIVLDEARNQAYDAALRRAIRPGDRVLEIGTGTGLLAMMAARAGATEVVTCEANPVVAAAASDIVKQNGFADRVRVIAKPSDALKPGVDIDALADILVSEIVSNNLLGEGVLLALEKAAPLLRRRAKVIPARGIIRIALAEDRKEHLSRMGIVGGFDLTAFNRLAPPLYKIPVGSNRLILRSEPADLFSFDFQSLGPFATGRTALSVKASGGVIGGVAQWFRLEMDATGSYENAPSAGASSSWAVQFFPLATAVELEPGTEVIVHGAHDRQSLRLWTDPIVKEN